MIACNFTYPIYRTYIGCSGPGLTEPSRSAKLWAKPTAGAIFKKKSLQTILKPRCLCSKEKPKQKPNGVGSDITCGLDRENQYDGEEEYWVTIKESGKKIESLEYSETHEKEQEASDFCTRSHIE